MYASKVTLAAIISLLPLSLALMPIQVVPYTHHNIPSTSSTLSNSTASAAANACPTVTARVSPEHCYKNVQACPMVRKPETTTVPCGCPASAWETTTVTACPGCELEVWTTVTAGGC